MTMAYDGSTKKRFGSFDGYRRMRPAMLQSMGRGQLPFARKFIREELVENLI